MQTKKINRVIIIIGEQLKETKLDEVSYDHRSSERTSQSWMNSIHGEAKGTSKKNYNHSFYFLTRMPGYRSLRFSSVDRERSQTSFSPSNPAHELELKLLLSLKDAVPLLPS